MPIPGQRQAGLERLRALSKATAAATASPAPRDIVSASVEALIRFFPVERADAWMLEDGRLRHAASAARQLLLPAPGALLVFERVTRGQLTQCVALSDLEGGGGEEWRRVLYAAGVRELGIYALGAGGRAIGCLTVGHGSGASAISEDLTMYANHVAQALETARLLDTAHEAASVMQLQNRMLAELADCRNVETLVSIMREYLGDAVASTTSSLLVFHGSGRAVVFPCTAGNDTTVEAARLATPAEHDVVAAIGTDGVVRDISPFEVDLRTRGALCRLLGDAGHELVAACSLSSRGNLTGAVVAAAADEVEHARLRRFFETAVPALTIGLENALMFSHAQMRTERLARANELARQLASAASITELYERLTCGMHEELGYSRAALYEGGTSLQLDVGAAASNGGRLEAQLLATAMRRRHVSRSEHPDITGWGVPLVVRGKLHAVLCLELGETAVMPLDDTESELLQSLADHAGGALSVLSAYDELERNYMATVQALASALEATDQYTHDHAQDVAMWAVEVGRRLGLSDQDLRDLELGAVFHDIGKIAIPSEILNKPGKLTDEEFEVMKTHTIIGERIIAPIEFLQGVRPIVRHEHERWDGRGYPDGIAGEDIPLGSRIVFVCDAYHAITSDRPYRKARPHAVAREILEENAGTQFDPAVVSVFLDVVEQHRLAQGEASGEGAGTSDASRNGNAPDSADSAA